MRSSAPANSLAIQGEAWQLMQLANQDRAALGLRPLFWDPALATAARQHCQRMVAEGQLAHRYGGEPDLDARAGQAGAHFSLIEENIAIAPDPVRIHQGWMHSPGHRANLLNPEIDRIGVAVVAARDGLYAVADYARYVPVLNQNQVEQEIGRRIRDRGVNILDDRTDARAACALDRGLPSPLVGPQPQFVMRWQDAHLNQLPQALLDRLGMGRYRQAAVGSCPAQEVEGAFTVYRATVLLY